MRIYIIRHGETEANAKGILQGWADYPLNEYGEHLAVVTGQKLSNVQFDAAFSSPLRRAYKTCELILKNSGNDLTHINIDDRLKEINAGEWEGKQFGKESKELPPEKLRLFYDDTFAFGGFPGGETISELCDRTQNFLREIGRNRQYSTVLVSTHGCAMRAMLNFIYENKQDFWHGHVPKNCAVNIVETDGVKFNLIGDDLIYYESLDCIDIRHHR